MFIKTIITGLVYDLTNMSWVQSVENYGKSIILNENIELEPVKCDSYHNTICSVNNSLLIEREHGGLDGMQDTGKENRSPATPV